MASPLHGTRDCLTALPPEILYCIFDYLYPSHRPDLAHDEAAVKAHPRQARRASNLLATALTCARLHAQVQRWCLHFLKRHSSITKYKPLKTAHLQARRVFLRELLNWSTTHCVFCGKKSVRLAVLMNGSYKCCAECDKQQWPDKITKTAAKRTFDLRDHHLLPHLACSSKDAGRLLDKHTQHLPRVRYGTFMSSNVLTTLFLVNDVKALADVVHGDWKLHMKRKGEEAERRRDRRQRQIGLELNRQHAKQTMTKQLQRVATSSESPYLPWQAAGPVLHVPSSVMLLQQQEPLSWEDLGREDDHTVYE